MMPIEDLVWRIRSRFLSGDGDAVEYARREIERLVEAYRRVAFDAAARIAEQGNPVDILAGTDKDMPVGLLTAVVRTNIGMAIRRLTEDAR